MTLPKKKPLRVLVLMHDTLVPPDDISRCTQAQLDEFRTEYDVVQQLKRLGYEVRCLGLSDNLPELTQCVTSFKPHLAFNLAEEFQSIVSYDQHVVSYLELLRLPYTGCNPRGLTLSRDKALTKCLLQAQGIATPAFVVLKRGERLILPPTLAFPLFVKSVRDDASYGIAQSSMVNTLTELKARVAFVHQHTGSDALVEAFIAGRELYVSVIGNDRPQCYPVWEMDFGSAMQGQAVIATRKAKWDRHYRHKHGIGSHRAKLPKTQLQMLQDMALRAYRALSLSGYARMDFRLDANGQAWLLEVNANPCLTAAEDFARSAKAGGDNYAALLDKIITLGRRYRAPWKE